MNLKIEDLRMGDILKTAEYSTYKYKLLNILSSIKVKVLDMSDGITMEVGLNNFTYHIKTKITSWKEVMKNEV